MTPRLYHPVALRPEEPVALDRERLHYLTRVLRLGVGAELVLFDGRGGEWRARLEEAAPPGRVTLLEHDARERESPLAITLVHGMAKGPALELALQKGVELGIAAYIPLVAGRSVNRPRPGRDGNRERRWRRIAEEAAELTGRTRLPVIHEPVPWEGLAPLLPPGPRLLAWEERPGNPGFTALAARARQAGSATLLIGPEGGLTPGEVAWAERELGFQVVGLGPRLMRTETAVIAAVAALQALAGDLAGGGA